MIIANTTATPPSTSVREGHVEIWLIRHGETEWSLSGQHTGRTDIPLTDRGRRQAELLRARLAGQPFDQVFTSPMSRAIETCRAAGLGTQAQVRDDLHEWDYGIYEGRTTPEIRQTAPDWSVWNSPIPSGEGLEQIQTRARGVVGSLLALHGRIAIFSHAHFLRVLAGCWMADSAALGAHLTLDTASVSILGFDRENRALRQWNVRCSEAE
jgi:broad specificity phosphatase PhoE